MKKVVVILLAVAMLISFSTYSQAAVKVFKNCAELNKIYPGGVALPGAVNAGGAIKMLPKYDRSMYLANKKSDRDKDGIACEK